MKRNGDATRNKFGTVAEQIWGREVEESGLTFLKRGRMLLRPDKCMANIARNRIRVLRDNTLFNSCGYR